MEVKELTDLQETRRHGDARSRPVDPRLCADMDRESVERKRRRVPGALAFHTLSIHVAGP